jgi:hypothetical protein
MTDGRRKGQTFMLEQCRVLAHWWFGTPLSLHYTMLPLRPKSTVVAPMEGWARKGDLDVHPQHATDWPFAVECKNDERWEGLERLWESPKYPLWSWWKQCVAQAGTWENAHPLLLFSRNRRKTYVLARYKTLEWLDSKPQHGPVVRLERPSEEPLGMLLLDDLVAREPPHRSSRRKASPRRSTKSST